MSEVHWCPQISEMSQKEEEEEAKQEEEETPFLRSRSNP